MEELRRAPVSALSAYRSMAPRGGPHEQPPCLAHSPTVSPGSQKIKKRRTKRRTPGACPVPSGAANGEHPLDSHPVPTVVDAAAAKLAKRRRMKLRSRLVATSSGPRVALQENRERSPMAGESCSAAAAPPAAGQEKERASAQQFQAGPSLRHLLQELGEVQHSREKAARLFEWLIAPVSSQRFFGQHWEKKPLLIRRRNPAYYQGLFSTAEFDAVLRDQEVQFGVNLDVTSYEDGKRETHNPLGRALPAVVWDFYRNGCSLRMLNPQAFSATVWHFLSLLQEQFGSMVGANTYLTPAGTQGFAPHYDDIEAFVVQLEGKKHWRVYSPRKEAEVLPQFSSPNFAQEEIGEPVLETVLEAGDLLYFPRGFIHQGDCLPDAHSLHITVSSFQRNSWGDLLEKLLPAALQMAIEEDVEYRQGLPTDYLAYTGVVNSDVIDPRRTAFMKKVQTLITKLMNYAPVDAAVDQKAKGFFHDCLPPVLTETEKTLSVYGLPARWENGDVRDVDVPFSENTQVRLLRYGIVRLCNEGDKTLLYYTAENSRVYHKEEPKYCEIEPEYTDGIEFLLSSYPKYVSVEDLPCVTLDDKIALATVLFEKGLLITKSPLFSA
ncbi:PREDICTED: bifunctional lysine-specific demethylase and histidyl-hydroxylase NO66 [Gekko japonicus]|uniref:Bifunctional lysine-specific demethylase and histidyl-hydroxylase n=1 Tax=Gekko japonicus TaxID=146911 RepID=A0ABM1K3Q0_GEKJA|nr:PREDICTED: bifunctional lysine-specific demethylase and histidyl-hydroxylase NO66 [Gekko japonicus]